ncbi:ABC transporter substrate-binding protein [Microbacteriaceae bacterium VKM Ac-2855]|nr:ABC transporter substrate-binding protein [Microbacteriaceae bacterium VKM Ac-2855]
MTRIARRVAPALLATVTAVALLAGCAGTAEGADSTADGVTVESQLGPVTIPADIDSIVVLEGRRDLDIVLSLGLPLVGVPYREVGEADLEAPLAEAYAVAAENGAEELFLDDEINIEAVAAAAPSLIISRVDDVEPILEELQAIAPVLAIGDQDRTTWQEDLLLVAEATGTSAKAEELIAEYDARVAEIASTYADVIAANTVVPLGTDSEGSQVRPNRLLSTALTDVGAQPSAAFAEAVSIDDGVEYGPEQLFDAHQDADGIVALVNTADEWEATQADPLWQQLPAVQAGHVVRSDRGTHEGGPITAMWSLDVIESLYLTF